MSELPSTLREQLSALLPDDEYTITADEVMASVESKNAERWPTPHTGPAMPTRRLRLKALTPALAWMLALIVLAAVGIGVGVGVSGTSNLKIAAGSTSKLSDYLHLDETRIAAGRSVNGSLVVHNPGRTINLTPRTREVDGQTVAGCQPSLFVELYRGSYSQQIYVPNPCDQGPLLVKHGTTKLPVTVMTTYGVCSPSGPSSANMPRCLASGRPPPLPPGRYLAKSGWTGSVPLPEPKAVALTLSPAVEAESTCEASQLRLTSDLAGWHANYAASGQFTEPFTFTNVSQTTCDLAGWPGIQALVNGTPQATQATRVLNQPRSARVTLAPSATASFDIYGEDWNAPHGVACSQTTSGFLVIPPNDKNHIAVLAVEPDCGLFLVAQLVPGSVDLMPWISHVTG
jgi:hypothetical protein